MAMQQQSRRDRLCEICQTLGPTEQGLATKNNLTSYYGALENLKMRPECSLCRLILKMLSSDRPIIPNTATIPTQGRVSVLGRFDWGLDRGLDEGLDDGLHVFYDGAYRGRITSNPPFNASSETLSLMPHLIKNWIMECESCHQNDPSELAPRYKHPVELVLVDVLSQNLVRASSSWRFLTISYVWGRAALETTNTANRMAREQEGALSKVKLPQLILDAMLLVSQLGERYLWVDCLCIEQDNPSQKHSQVSQMDVIYSQSLLTLVALSSKDAGSCLPGVRDGTRSFFKTKDYIFNRDIYALYLRLPELSEGSVYESRGWTFQERLLSRRCLFLTECDMYYTCHSRLSCETGVNGADDETGVFNQKFQSIFAQINSLSGQNPSWVRIFGLYASLVHEYSKRELSYGTDAINAFSGISAVLGHFLNSIFVSGLIECILDACLLWVPWNSNTNSRNLNFSSWSWAGWRGRVYYLRTPLHRRDVAHYGSEPLLTSLVDKFETLYMSPLRPISRLLQHQENSAIANPESKGAAKGIDLLSFKAATADITQLNLSSEWSAVMGDIYDGPNKGFGYHVRLFTIIDANQHECGYLHSFRKTPSPARTREPNHRELVALSLSQYPSSEPIAAERSRANPTWAVCYSVLFDHTIFEPKPWCLLNIMLIEWKGNEAERVTIGQMHIDAWNSLKTQRKRIRLI